MSHFSVLVITDKQVNEDELAEIMGPYHEFECTGIDDQYVETIDITEDVEAEWERQKTDEDYKGKTIEEFIKDYYNYDLLPGYKPGAGVPESHKYGFYIKDESGKVSVFDRTNPNKKWDWYRVGGRWSGMLLARPGAVTAIGSPGVMGTRHDENGADQCRRGDLDVTAMKARARDGRHKVAEIEGYTTVTAGKLIAEYSSAIAYARELWEKSGKKSPFGEWIEQSDSGSAQAIRRLRKEHPKITNRFWHWPENIKDFGAWCNDAPWCGAFAVLKDGKWYEQGKMGWWAIVTDEKDEKDWQAELAELVLNLDRDKWITVVDCHI